MNALFKIFKLETPAPVIEENAVDTNMAQRPLLLDDYIGQDFIREQVRLKVNLAKKTGVPMTHTLLLGYSGAGKTTLAKIIANELGVDFHECMAANIKTEVDFYHLMTSTVTEGMVLFIDEIHAM
jgi:Holliday junction DNA helicase RuvB